MDEGGHSTAVPRRSISYSDDDDESQVASTSVLPTAQSGQDDTAARRLGNEEDELDDDVPADVTALYADETMANTSVANSEAGDFSVEPRKPKAAAPRRAAKGGQAAERAAKDPLLALMHKDGPLTEAEEATLAGEIIPEGANPGSSELYSNAPPDKLFRNTPIKKPDGSTILRSDLQHALLIEIFADRTRCFTNPRPAPDDLWTYPPKLGEAAATGVYEYSPVYPYGQSKGSSRRSNETPEEFDEWQKRYDEYWKNPYPSQEEDPEKKVPRPGAKMLTFKELYMEALMNSPRCTKAVRDKVWADEQFAEDFACVNLLINVGRMNTTLAFFAQMQTVLRSYHPLPSLQNCENSRRHMQDAPRMKSLLKSILLPFEKASIGPASAPATKAAQAANTAYAVPEEEQLELPATLDEVVQRRQAGYHPATSVANLLFILPTAGTELSQMHFLSPHDAHSIFFPSKDVAIPARVRARAFLWLVWHYYEGGAVLPPGNEAALRNPFADEQARKSMARAKSKYEQLDDKGRRNATLGKRGNLWLGVRSKKATLDIKQEGGGEGSTAETTRELTPLDTSSGPSETWSVEENERWNHRILAPAMPTCSIAEVSRENVDQRHELLWGREQAAERREFMIKMEEEEKLKAEAVARGEEFQSSTGRGKGKGKRKGRGKAQNKMAPVRMTEGDESEDELAVPTVSLKSGAASGRWKKPRLDTDDPLEMLEQELAYQGAMGGIEMGGGASHSRSQRSPSEGDVSLLGPTTKKKFKPIVLPPKRPLLTSDLAIPPEQRAASLPGASWSRILNRAIRGQGDACYSSDDEDVAMEEAERCGDEYRGELSRILGCVWSRGKELETVVEKRGGRIIEGKVGNVKDPYRQEAAV